MGIDRSFAGFSSYFLYGIGPHHYQGAPRRLSLTPITSIMNYHPGAPTISYPGFSMGKKSFLDFCWSANTNGTNYLVKCQQIGPMTVHIGPRIALIYHSSYLWDQKVRSRNAVERDTNRMRSIFHKRRKLINLSFLVENCGRRR